MPDGERQAERNMILFGSGSAREWIGVRATGPGWGGLTLGLWRGPVAGTEMTMGGCGL